MQASVAPPRANYRPEPSAVSNRLDHLRGPYGDGRDEAIVPVLGVGGMGRLPLLDVFVYGYEEATLRLLLFKNTHFGPLWTYVTNGKLAISETDYGPGEAACCASNAELTTYTWRAPYLGQGKVETAPCNQEHPVFGRIFCPRA